MRKTIVAPFLVLAAAALFVPSRAPSAASPAGAPSAKVFPLDTLAGIEGLNVRPELATWKGRRAVRLIDRPRAPTANPRAGGEAIAILAGSEFGDGMIEVELAGAPRAGAKEGSRGFIGIAFRVRSDASAFECFYLRPTNGRADDQLRRNHSTQYISFPDWPWERLRKESPGVYESYVDLEAGAWTKVRIVVSGTKARLFVHGAAQPSLIVDDLKLGASRGAVALWIGDDTDGYFSNLSVR
jgi:hypothetical protein